ncbi:MAG: nicotinate-nucleotide--dimethylbenzimidazole phosphoribosyltransferase [Deltaproteobacteria bacterium]|nr:nicotinate-nucleotide--dimethylbenzimidazole phosphoribosyltransferase [Deltaproteobacteria bacterium]
MLNRIISEIQPLSKSWYDKAWARLDNLSKPKRSLGVLEDIAARVVAVREEERPVLDKKAVFVFAGDHGVVAEGVSAYPQEVTGAMVRNFLKGGAGINVLARRAGAEVSVIDIGMKEDIRDLERLVRRNVKRGTDNMAEGPAMTVEDAEKAVNVGIKIALEAGDQGKKMIATGEMGIGNTTPSSALFSVLLPADVRDVTDKGTGLEDEAIRKKAEVIEKAIAKNRDTMRDPLSVLAAVGGLEIAGICGLCLGGAARRLAVVVDGFISSAGALVAMRMCPAVREYLFFSHRSYEKGHRMLFEKEGLRPILDLDLRLGEGTGAAIAMQIIEDALAVYNEMATFDDIDIEPGA